MTIETHNLETDGATIAWDVRAPGHDRPTTAAA